MSEEENEENEIKEDGVVLCAANSYEKKYYLNSAFNNLPQDFKDELQIMCVLYTNEVGGILLLEFDSEGNLKFKTEAMENDFSYDDIGSVLKIKELQRDKEDFLRTLELYYQVMTGKITDVEL